MEVLSVLESRIKGLVELACKLKHEGAKLKEENSRLESENILLIKRIEDLQSQVASFEGAIVTNSKNLDELSQEKELTKLVVDDLIKSIDLLVQENQQ